MNSWASSPKFLFFLIAATLSVGCSVEISLTSILPATEESPSTKPRTGPDFIHGEIITTTTGHTFRGTFGELSEKKSLSNGYKFEGAFYE